MAKTAFVTGCLGNLGTYITERLLSEGYQVVGIDNDARGQLLGASVLRHLDRLKLVENFKFVRADIRDFIDMEMEASCFDLIIHCAAQVSHPHSIDIPMEDFQINAYGTLRLLESVRKHSDDSTFVYIGSAKIYGENVDKFPQVELPTRYDYPFNGFKGISERCSFDQTLKTPFGCSKAYADLITQEYGLLYGLKTMVWRPSCFVGKYTVPSLLQRWEAWIMLNILRGEPVRIFGYKGKQVRDILHCEDLVNAIMLLVNEPPKKGEVFNIGGGRENSLSILECIELVRNVTGLSPTKIIYEDKRAGDWRVYVTDNSKLIQHYPEYRITWNLERIFVELSQSLVELKNVL